MEKERTGALKCIEVSEIEERERIREKERRDSCKKERERGITDVRIKRRHRGTRFLYCNPTL